MGSIFEVENISKRSLGRAQRSVNASLELNLTAHYEGSRLSFCLFSRCSVVGVVVWFPLQISERSKTRKRKGEKVAEK